MAVLLCATATAAAATLKADYRFHGNLASSIGTAPPAENLGSSNAFATENIGGKPRSVLTFPAGGGLSIPTADVVPADNYTIAVVFRLTDLGDPGDYRRIADFKAGTSDNGVYFESHLLSFYTSTSFHQGDVSVGTNQYVQVLLRRTAEGDSVQFAGYLNSDFEWNITDLGPETLLSNGLRLFKDDNPTPGVEDASGAVARVRIWEAPSTLPRSKRSTSSRRLTATGTGWMTTSTTARRLRMRIRRISTGPATAATPATSTTTTTESRMRPMRTRSIRRGAGVRRRPRRIR